MEPMLSVVAVPRLSLTIRSGPSPPSPVVGTKVGVASQLMIEGDLTVTIAMAHLYAERIDEERIALDRACNCFEGLAEVLTGDRGNAALIKILPAKFHVGGGGRRSRANREITDTEPVKSAIDGD